MIKKYFLLFILLFIFGNITFSQNDFNIIGNKESVTIPFKLVNNLILLPVKLNNQKLTLILDTGVSKTLLFNLVTKDSIKLKKTKKVRIKGLGKGTYFDAIISNNNLLRIKNIISPNFDIYLILNVEFDFSARLGVNINGLIGTDLLKNFIVEINYIRKKIKFTKAENYTYKKCKKCDEFDLLFYNKKPYIKPLITSSKNKYIPANLLIDSGSVEAIWLFENSNTKFLSPKNSKIEFIGKGLSGNIFGKKGKLNGLKLNDFKLNNMIVSYPDSTSLKFLNNNTKRNGTLGSEILYRFNIILDYPNNKITLKKNNNFKKPFYYDKSGLEIIHNGKMLIDVGNQPISFSSDQSANPIVSFSHNYQIKNSYIVSYVKYNSPAEIAGLKENDLILEINNIPIFEYTLQQINQILAAKAGDKIKILIDRNGFKYTYKFKLKDTYYNLN